MSRHVLSSLILAIVLLPVSALSAADSARPASKPDKKAADKNSVEKRSKRLPSQYGEVVDDSQREKIYGIQAQYLPQIDQLKEQLKALVSKRDAEVEAVLTSGQREQVLKLRAEAQAKRAAERAKRAAESATSTAPLKPAS